MAAVVPIKRMQGLNPKFHHNYSNKVTFCTKYGKTGVCKTPKKPRVTWKKPVLRYLDLQVAGRSWVQSQLGPSYDFGVKNMVIRWILDSNLPPPQRMCVRVCVCDLSSLFIPEPVWWLTGSEAENGRMQNSWMVPIFHLFILHIFLPHKLKPGE